MIPYLTEKGQDICRDAIETFGIENQISVAIEEMSELIKELTKYMRIDAAASPEHLSEEMADVYIAMEQLFLLFGNQSKVKYQMFEKILRLRDRISAKRQGEKML